MTVQASPSIPQVLRRAVTLLGEHLTPLSLMAAVVQFPITVLLALTVPASPASLGGSATHEAIRAAAGDTPIGLVATGSLIHRLDLWSRPGSVLPERAQVFLAAAHRALESGAWEELWEVDGQAMRAAAPEGGRFPLAVMRGALPCFSGKVLAEELEFGAVSLSTVELIPCPQPTPV